QERTPVPAAQFRGQVRGAALSGCVHRSHSLVDAVPDTGLLHQSDSGVGACHDARKARRGRAGRAAQTRPRTGIDAPVIAAAASDSRNTMTAASCAGCTQRPKSALGMSARLAGVSMMLGTTALTVMSRSLSSSASASVNRATPLLDAAYAPMPAPACAAAAAPMLTMRPPPPRCASAARLTATAVRRLTR